MIHPRIFTTNVPVHILPETFRTRNEITNRTKAPNPPPKNTQPKVPQFKKFKLHSTYKLTKDE